MRLGQTRNIQWRQPTSRRAKIGQLYKKGLEFALVSPDYKQATEFVYCKDFLLNVIHAAIHEKNFTLYNFFYSPRVHPPVDLSVCRLLVTNASDKNMRLRIPGCLDFMNQLENDLGIKNTKIRQCANPPEQYAKCGVWYIEGSRRWLNAPPMLSLYTLMLRIGFVHEPGMEYQETFEALKAKKIRAYQSKDVHQYTASEPAIHRIMSLGDRKVFYRDIRANYPNTLDIETLHHDFGIQGYARQLKDWQVRREVPIPYWCLSH